MCGNASCGKVFAKPINAKNVGSRDAEAYDACPYCLSEVREEQAPIVITTESDLDSDKIEAKPAEVTKPIEDKPEKLSSKPSGCLHQFGYLSKRSPKEQIPEECIVCEDIVKCMLKAITG